MNHQRDVVLAAGRREPSELQGTGLVLTGLPVSFVGFYPRCGDRRMTECAVDFVDEVLPWVPVRQ